MLGSSRERGLIFNVIKFLKISSYLDGQTLNLRKIDHVQNNWSHQVITDTSSIKIAGIRIAIVQHMIRANTIMSAGKEHF